MLNEYLLIGEVLRPQGIKGLVKVRPDTDDPYRFEAVEEVYVKQGSGYTLMAVEDVSVRDDGVYLRLDHAEDRNKAERQRGLMLYVDRAHAVLLEENENFICDLIGCEVVDTAGKKIGVLKDVLQPGANDVYVIKAPDGELLVPALQMVFPTVDVENRRIVCDEKILPQVSVRNE